MIRPSRFLLILAAGCFAASCSSNPKPILGQGVIVSNTEESVSINHIPAFILEEDVEKALGKPISVEKDREEQKVYSYPHCKIVFHADGFAWGTGDALYRDSSVLVNKGDSEEDLLKKLGMPRETAPESVSYTVTYPFRSTAAGRIEWARRNLIFKLNSSKKVDSISWGDYFREPAK